ncbi:MAG: hypothetical protein DID91_2727704541 [Candidatus Nitrotoga sp. MKT]|nr:MAG: hypothetical protein DID91_2727704541 [Candidatus Nitrotoga sp. MKT]
MDKSGKHYKQLNAEESVTIMLLIQNELFVVIQI